MHAMRPDRPRRLLSIVGIGVISVMTFGALARPSAHQQAPARPAPPAPVSSTTASGSSSSSGAGAISGVVVDAVSGRPVPGAIVSLGQLDNKQQLPQPRTVTDARGRFVFSHLPASPSYYLGARRFGYTYTRYGWASPNGSLAIRDIAQIPIADGQWVSDIKIPLWRLGAIAGRVTDERNEPVVGVAVRAFSTRTIAGQAQLVAGPITTTDDRGVYRLSDLEPGRYVVSVLSVQSTVPTTTPEAPQQYAIGELLTGGIGAGKGSTVSTPGIDIDGRHRLVMSNFATPPPPNVGESRAYPAVYFPSGRTAAEAEPIEIGYGDSRNAVDMQLRPVPVARVSGRVDSPTGTLPPFLLRLMPAGGERLGFGSEVATTLVDRDGAFTFLNVPEGSYTILAQASVMDFTSGSAQVRLADAPGFPAGGISVGSMGGVPGLSYLARNGQPSPLWGRTSVSVGAGGRDDVIVPLHRTVTIAGRVVLAEGTASPNRSLLLRAHPANGDPSLGQPSGATKSGDTSLAFSIQGLLGGTYLLNSAITTFSIVSIVSRGRDLTDTGFDASQGMDFDDVVVTLTDKQAEIAGSVRDNTGSVTAAVIAFPVEPARWQNYGWDPPRFQATRSASNGSFRLQQLPKGDYYLVAVDVSKFEAWTDPRFLAAAARVATRVSLEWGDKASQDLKLVEVVVK